MLGTTASGLFWMLRHLERSENTARLIEAGLRIALTRPSGATDEWASVVTTAGVRDAYSAKHNQFEGPAVIDFLLRDDDNTSSVNSLIDAARNNARLVRTALTREVWEATNECWMNLSTALAQPVQDRDLPRVLALIRRENAQVRGALSGTMMRTDAYDFAQLGLFIERSDNTARILDVKYYLLLPAASHVGSRLDNVQWETILRSVSAQRAFRWTHPGVTNPRDIADFLILDQRMPRSLAYCYSKINDNLAYLATNYGVKHDCHMFADTLRSSVTSRTIDNILDQGLHEFLRSCITNTSDLASQIEIDYRFNK